MSERAVGCNAIADKLLDLFDLGKAPVLLARPDDVAVEPHLEDASCCVGREDDRPELLRERRQQLLRHPAGAQAPAAQAAVCDLDRGRSRHHNSVGG